MLRIHLIANRSPWPPTNGASIRQYYILKALKERGHHVEVFSFAEPHLAEESERKVLEIADGGRIVPLEPLPMKLGAMRAVLTGDPLSVGYFRSAELYRAIARSHRAAPVDAAVVHSSNVAQYVPRELKPRSFLDMADVDSAKFADYVKTEKLPMKLVYALEARRLRRYEFDAIRDFGETCLVAERERDLIRDELDARRLAGKVTVITSGVDTHYFHPQAHKPLDPSVLPEGERRFFRGGAPRIAFTGVMDYPPNAEAAIRFAEDVLPRVRAQVPDAEFYVVGSKPTPRVRELEKLPGVHVTGFVDDARPYFTSAHVYVLPLRIARGVQNKALEAMASGCAIVSTPSVAEGLRIGAAKATDGEHLLIADEDEAFASRVVELLRDGAMRERLGAAARQLVERHFGWDPLMGQVVDRIEAVARSGDAGVAGRAAPHAA